MNDFVAGLIGGLAGLVVGHPLDTVKALMQTGGNTSTLDSAKLIAKKTTVVIFNFIKIYVMLDGMLCDAFLRFFYFTFF